MKKIIILILLFSFITAAMTYPLAFKMNSYIPGFHSTDEPYAALWNFWWFKYAFKHHLEGHYYSTLAAPFGLDVGKTALYPLWEFLCRWLSILTEMVLSFNIQMLLSFILAGIIMYYLVLYLTGEVFVSLFAAFAYAFCPYHFARAWQHLGLAQIQWMPLFIFTLIKLREKSDNRNTLFAILALFLVFSFELHYAYFMYIVAVLFLIYYTLSNRKFNSAYFNVIWRLCLVLVIGAFFVLPTSAMTGIRQMFFKKSTAIVSVWSAIRPFEDLFAQSARPLSYFLPATTHPIFGKFAEYFVGSPLYGESFTEHTLYLGWIPLLLTFFAFRQWRKNKKLRITNYESRITNFYVGFFLLLAVASWFLSQPPWWKIGQFKVYMHTFFLYKIVPIFRAYCRFGIVLMLAVAVLAAFGLKFILEKYKSRKLKLTITTLFCVLMFFEFWNYPPFKVIDVSRISEAYYWLKSQPGDFAIAEYPLDADSPNETYKFYQATHEKRIINGTIPGTYPNRLAKKIKQLSDFNTPKVLRWLGVEYVLVHHDAYLGKDLIEDRDELKRISNNPGLRLIKTFPAERCTQDDIICVRKSGPIDIYKVVAGPSKPVVEEK